MHSHSRTGFLLLSVFLFVMAGCEKKTQQEEAAGAESAGAEGIEEGSLNDTSESPEVAAETGESEPVEAPGDPVPVGLPPLTEDARSFLDKATHFIVVVTPEWSSPAGRLALFERGSDGWKLVHGPMPTNVGYNGISWGRGLTLPPEDADRIKKEGDKTAPAGLFKVSTAMGYEPEPPPGLNVPYEPVDRNTHCVDDVDSPKYNRVVQLDEGEEPEWSSSEILRREDELYHTLLLIDHNGLTGEEETIPGAGSCIFLHEWGGEDMATVGCTSVAAPLLEDVLTALPSLEETVFVQLPEGIYKEATPEWELPPLPANQR